MRRVAYDRFAITWVSQSSPANCRVVIFLRECDDQQGFLCIVLNSESLPDHSRSVSGSLPDHSRITPESLPSHSRVIFDWQPDFSASDRRDARCLDLACRRARDTGDGFPASTNRGRAPSSKRPRFRASSLRYAARDPMTTPTTRPPPSIDQVRSQFPALERRHNGSPVAYFDGPGGTQVP